MRYIKRNSRVADEKRIELYRRQCHVSDVVAALLWQRGIPVEDAQAFLNPDKTQLGDPLAFRNMKAVRRRILDAVEREEKIAVYSDYDCDGVCGSAILCKALDRLGGDVQPYIPDRFMEGYGTNRGAFEKLINAGVNLIITVDCGIRSNDDVAYAIDRGVDVIILDHHECGELPPTPYILDAKVPGETYPFSGLCGAGVAYQVARGLLGRQADDYLDIAAVATIGDLVEVTGENRAIAALGIKRLRKFPCAGLRALAQAAGIRLSETGSYQVGFVLAPRLNAAGRLEHGMLSWELLMEQDAGKAEILAKKLNELNAKRQKMQRKVVEEAVARVKKEVDLSEDRIILLADEGWEKGVVGLAASGVCERFHRPAIIFSQEEDVLVGSARSTDEINLYEALSQFEADYERFGGHAKAAGLTIQSEALPVLRNKLNEYLRERYPQECFLPSQEYDIQLDLKKVSPALAGEIARLEPFGLGNEPPVFLFRNVGARQVTPMGSGEHIKIIPRAGVEIVDFFTKQAYFEGERYCFAGNLSINTFRGKSTPQIVVASAQPETAGSIGQYRERNHAEYICRFSEELMALDQLAGRWEGCQAILDWEEFVAKIADAVQKSPFGTAIFVLSDDGCSLAQKITERLDLPASNTLPDSAENCICLQNPGKAMLRSYPRVFLLGAFSLKNRLFAPKAPILYTGAELVEKYVKRAKEYYVPGERMRAYARAIIGAAKIGAYPSLNAYLSRAASLVGDEDMKKIWSVFQIFCELTLLDVKKSDKIHINYLRKSADFEESRLYQTLKKYAGRGET